MSGGLDRLAVAAMLAAGTRWQVRYCRGSLYPNEVGQGLPLPSGVLERVPTASKLRKRRNTGKTYFYATLEKDSLGTLLILEEP